MLFDFEYEYADSIFKSSADTSCTGDCTHNINDATCHAQTDSIHDAMIADGFGSNTDIVAAFIGHDLCIKDENRHGNCGGVKSSGDDWCLIEGRTSTLSELSTFIHELGHVLNAPDHYDSKELKTASTQTLNEDETNRYYLAGYKYNEYCIYGEDDSADYALALCEGCTYQIKTYVSKLMNGTEQIG